MAPASAGSSTGYLLAGLGLVAFAARRRRRP
ncbi:MAG: PEP-CTERM sorting domain-containing protein [Polyangiaceae bacterium]